MSVVGLSPLAKFGAKLKNGEPRKTDPYGLCVHTTGGTIVEKAQKLKRDPLDFAAEYYLRPDSFWSHYLISWDGTIVQLSNEVTKALHVGWSAQQRDWCLSGTWREHLPEKSVSLWDQAWPAVKSPAHLYPGSSPNQAYIGVELLPTLGTMATLLDKPYTKEQHAAVKALAKDIATRWSWPEGWSRSGRLCGHEDLSPFDRHDRSGQCWDPGARRDRPRFSWESVR